MNKLKYSSQAQFKKKAFAGAAINMGSQVLGMVLGSAKAKKDRESTLKESKLIQEQDAFNTENMDYALSNQQSEAVLAQYDPQGSQQMYFNAGGYSPYPYQDKSTTMINPTIGFKGGGTMADFAAQMSPEDMQVPGGQLNPISNNAVQVQGNNPNGTDQVELPGAMVDNGEVIKEDPNGQGERIYSDTLKPPGSKETFAKLAKKLEKQKAPGFEDQNDRVESKLNELFTMQQVMNGNSQGEPVSQDTQGFALGGAMSGYGKGYALNNALQKGSDGKRDWLSAAGIMLGSGADLASSFKIPNKMSNSELKGFPQESQLTGDGSGMNLEDNESLITNLLDNVDNPNGFEMGGSYEGGGIYPGQMALPVGMKLVPIDEPVKVAERIIYKTKEIEKKPQVKKLKDLQQEAHAGSWGKLSYQSNKRRESDDMGRNHRNVDVWSLKTSPSERGGPTPAKRPKLKGIKAKRRINA